MTRILTLPDSSTAPLSIRAKALVFHDPGSQRLLDHVERVARSDATVLIIGETGTGKELIARHIHTTSGVDGPFVAVNCGAFSESLIDAELFGHESGAFTGASQARSGWFEAANGGTLFLDEIGDLPLALQVKLLRVLQERQVVRLGSRKPVALNVRLVAATNIDLGRAVEAQHFRADLYYRLSVATVPLPPLRDRQADILPLAEHFTNVFRARLGLTAPVVLSEEARQLLLSYSWPGNIRELENVIHYALIVCRGQRIEAADLKLVPLTRPQAAFAPQGASLVVGGLGTPSAAAPVNWPAQAYAGGGSFAQEGAWGSSSAEPAAAAPAGGEAAVLSVEDAARERLASLFQALLAEQVPDLFDLAEDVLIHSAFAASGDNQVRTAKVLGITRNMLRTQLKRHGLLADTSRESADDNAEPEPAQGLGAAAVSGPLHWALSTSAVPGHEGASAQQERPLAA